MLDCLSIGDATLDVFLTLHTAEVHCERANESCKLTFNYGDKIPVDEVSQTLGGNAANNAASLKKLGFNTMLFSVHGDDDVGKTIDNFISEQEIDKSFIQIQPQTRSPYSTILSFKGERTILEFRPSREYKLPDNLPIPSWVFLSSIGSNYQDFFSQVASFVQTNSLKLAFCPAKPQLNSNITTYKPILEKTQIIFMNKEEAAMMLTASGEIKDMLWKIRDLGPKIVVITDATHGSYAYDGDQHYFQPASENPCVEATGAGDAYAAGFMAAIMKGKTVPEAMRWGTANAGSVVTKVGSQAGLLTLEEISHV